MAFIHDVAEAFGEAECDALIALAERQGLAEATVYGGAADEVQERVRRARTGYHPRSDATAWVYERLDRLFAEAGPVLGGPPAPMHEPFQIVRYGPGDHFQTWHSDAGAGDVARLLSLSAELSPADGHEGGWLEIVPATIGRPRDLPRGGARIFHSRALHRVTPVVAGVRYALVAWAGPAA